MRVNVVEGEWGQTNNGRKYRQMTRHLLALAFVTTALAVPAAVRADTQPVSGSTASVLGIASSGPVALTNLTPGQTATGTGTVTVTSTGPTWVLRIQDASATNPGHLLRTTGSTGTSALAQALQWSASPSLGGTGGSGTLSGSATVAASGTLSDSVNVSYSQPVGATEQLAAGSVYSLTVTWTISAT
jgi:hypothetical protein